MYERHGHAVSVQNLLENEKIDSVTRVSEGTCGSFTLLSNYPRVRETYSENIFKATDISCLSMFTNCRML